MPSVRADGALLRVPAPRIEIGTLAGRDDEHVYFDRDNGVGFDMWQGGVAREAAA